jgi:hypothetical protein
MEVKKVWYTRVDWIQLAEACEHGYETLLFYKCECVFLRWSNSGKRSRTAVALVVPTDRLRKRSTDSPSHDFTIIN